MKKRILALILSFCMVPLAFKSSDFEKAEAASRQLNINVIFGGSELASYGVPSAISYRFPKAEKNAVEKYYYSFGINLNFIYKLDSQYIISSSAENCKTDQTEYTSICKHASDSKCNNSGPYHHTNYHVIKNDVISQRPYDKSQTAEMFITAVALCRVSNGTHGRVYGVSFTDSNFLVLRDYDYVDSTEKYIGEIPVERITALLVHEIGHLYGVKDHSNVSYGSSLDNCIWGYNNSKSSIQQELTICANCGATIRANSSKYNHS